MSRETESRFFRCVLPAAVALAWCGSLPAQTDAPRPAQPKIPLVELAAQSAAPMGQAMQTAPAAPAGQTTAGQTAAGQNARLTRREAEQMAIKNNPRVSVAHLLALAQHQVVRETRAAELPTGVGNMTAEDAENASRISAGSLTASRLFRHAGAGGGFTQLLTDFGHTTNLVASAKLEEKAQNASALATEEDIVLIADQAFFNALQAQALLRVAQQNVSTRQTTDTQVSEMTKNKLKSIAGPELCGREPVAGQAAGAGRRG